MQIVLSIIIPTHNRADDLREHLATLLPQCEDKPVEIIVVDSASNPDHAAAIQALPQLHLVQFIRLDRPGVSIARNAGVARAHGAWFGFLDDDVIPAADWVDSTLARIALSGNQLGVVAGRVLPRWPSVTSERAFDPSGLDRRSLVLLSVIDDTRVYCTSAAPLGISANLLIRREALLQVDGFPEHMGRVGTSLASGEDPYVIDEIVRRGFESWYDGTICVEHKIYGAQLTHHWMARRAWHEGLVSLRRCRSRRGRARVAAKCVATLPALLVLRTVASSRAEYVVRLYHNLSFVCGSLATIFRSRAITGERHRNARTRECGPQRLHGPASPSVAAAFPHDDAGG